MNRIAANPRATALEIALAVGITERSTRRVIADLLKAGYIAIEKEGRRNYYLVQAHRPLRRPGHQETAVGELIRILNPARSKPPA